MAYDLDEFENKAGDEAAVKDTEAAAKAAEEAQKAQEAIRAEKEAIQKELTDLRQKHEVVTNEFTKIKKAFTGDSTETAKDPYDELAALGFKPEEIRGLDKANEAWFKKKFGVTSDEFTKRYNQVAQTSSSSTMLSADLNYEKAKSRLFEEIQGSKSEIRVDYFAKRLEELEDSMKPEVFAQIKQLPAKELMETLKTTYYNEIGRVKADPKGVSEYRKFTDEAEKDNREDKLNSANKGGWASNIARTMKDSDFDTKPMSLQEATDKQLFEV